MEREELVWTTGVAGLLGAAGGAAAAVLAGSDAVRVAAVALAAALLGAATRATGGHWAATAVGLAALAAAACDPAGELAGRCGGSPCVPWRGLLAVAAQAAALVLAWPRLRAADGWDEWGLGRGATLGRGAAGAVAEAAAVAARAAAAGAGLAAAAGLLLLGRRAAPVPGAGALVAAAAEAGLRAGLLALAALWAARAAGRCGPLSPGRALGCAAAGDGVPAWLGRALAARPALRLRLLASPLPRGGAASAGRALLWREGPWSALLEALLAEAAGPAPAAAATAARTLAALLLAAPARDAAGRLVRLQVGSCVLLFLLFASDASRKAFPRALEALLGRLALLRRTRAAPPPPPAYLAAAAGAGPLLARPGREWRGLLRAAPAALASLAGGGGGGGGTAAEAALEAELRHSLYRLLAVPELRALAASAPGAYRDLLARFLEARE